MSPSVSDIYQQFVWEGNLSQLAAQLYNSPPLTMGGVFDRALSLLDKYSSTGWHTDDRRKRISKALISINRDLSILTPKVKKNISRLHNGAVEAAHQSVVMGGPCFVLNKAATATRIADLSEDRNPQLTSFFFIADYDSVQPELTNIRTPNVGQEGNLLSFPVEEGYEHSPVSALPLPSSEWYAQVEESIRAGYRPLAKPLSSQVRLLVEERLEQALSLTRWAYSNSSTLGQWAERILGRLFNIEGNLGIPILSGSDERIRSLLVEGLEFLLSRKNRERFLKAHEEATSLIVENGFKAGIGRRNDTYVPFFYECPGEGCNKARTELSYQVAKGTAELTGKCPSCSDRVAIETDANRPDLSEVSSQLSPRVDTRQIAVDCLLPVVAHVGGPGEAAYYAQVIPCAKALDIPFPQFLRYARVYFNTPWNEELAGTLKEKGFPTLHSPEMFKAAGLIGRFRKKKNYDKMNSALESLDRLLKVSMASLNQKHMEMSHEKPGKALKTSDDHLMTKLEVERYLSWVYGQFTKGKIGQEVTWSWIEWAINSGFPDLFGPYVRAYVPEMKNGATYFVNFTF
ncbi:MAG: bacillithiol biosynthesis BshC [Promethearchaeota archaeon]